MTVAALVFTLALAQADEPPTPVRVKVAASKGQVIPQSKGGGGFQRTLRFTAVPVRAGRRIMQRLTVRGEVFDAKGNRKTVHLDVVEYYRLARSGRAVSADSHYSQYWTARGGDLVISGTLTYGRLVAKRRGDTIVSKSYVLRGATDENGKPVTMKTRTIPRRVIPAEWGKRVTFVVDPGSIPTRYSYGVKWDTRPGIGSRTKPSGAIEVGTWQVEAPKQEGHTRAVARPRPIPPLE